MLKRLFYCLTILLCLCSCKYKVPETYAWDDYTFLPIISMEKDSLDISESDTFFIKTDFNEVMNSLVGHFFLKEDTFCFADEGTGSIFAYDITGKYIKTLVTTGRSKNEVFGIVTASINEFDNILTVDGNWGFNLFNKDWQKIVYRNINFNHSNRTLKEVLKQPNPALMDIYSIAYEWTSAKVFDNRYAIFPINTEHEKYNAYQGKNVEHYYKNARIFGICDLMGRTVDMFGSYSPWYYERCITNFNDVRFDVNGNNLYYSFGADSIIYVMDIPTRKIILGFGKAGKDMRQDYVRYDNFDQTENYYFEDRAKYGHYGNIKYEPETNRLYRVYYQGNDSDHEYVQVYENYILMGEIKVPKGTYYVGYLNGWTYFASDIADYEKDRFILYRYKIGKTN